MRDLEKSAQWSAFESLGPLDVILGRSGAWQPTRLLSSIWERKSFHNDRSVAIVSAARLNMRAWLRLNHQAQWAVGAPH